MTRVCEHDVFIAERRGSDDRNYTAIQCADCHDTYMVHEPSPKVVEYVMGLFIACSCDPDSMSRSVVLK